MTTHTIKKGFDLPLAGRAEAVLADAPEPTLVALETAAYAGIKPKALVKDGDAVKTGQPIFLDKLDRDVVWCSPVTGTVKNVVYGERRFLQRVEIERSGDDQFAAMPKADGDHATLVKAIKNAGLWPLFKQRPLGKMPRGEAVPAAIFVNGMDSAPLAADPAFAAQGRKQDVQAGLDVLKKLTSGKVYLTLRAAGDHQSELRDLRGVEVHDFAGPHPSGLVGTHIANIRPLKTGEVAWALTLQDVARLGEWARTGKYPAKTVVAVAGSEAKQRGYYRVRHGAPVQSIAGSLAGDVRVVDGTVLDGVVVAGVAVGAEAWLGLATRTITVMPEGTGKRDLFGWALPQFGKVSMSRSAGGGWLKPKNVAMDARLNGGHRPIVNIGAWESVMPLDILPTFLVRAIQANDLDEALKLGLLEVTEEDVALCTFVDPCKIDVGEVIRQGLDMYEKEG